MHPDKLKTRIPDAEIVFTATRSGGPGGQNVNKVSTRIELRFNVIRSPALSEREKEMILIRLKNRISSDGDLLVVSQSERSQLMNRKKAEERFFKLLAEALTEKKKRKPTQATKASKIKRIETKKQRGAIKRLRKLSDEGD